MWTRSALPAALAAALGFAGLTALTAAPAAAQGALAGTVVDGDLGETLPGANVLVVETGTGAATDLDGAYRVALPAGLYTVRFSFVGFETQTVTGVAVADGQTTGLNVVLTVGQLGEVVVEAEAVIETNSDVGLDRVRASAAAVSDAISAATISQSGASDAADAMERVTGASVQGGQYVFVRGLGDRYANTQLNGATLPTADPDRRAVQFDLFPSNFLDHIVTVKTFTPDRPGSFSGGLVDITTRQFPTELEASVSTSSGFSTRALPGGAFLSDPLQGASPFRFGGGRLALPDALAGVGRDQIADPTTVRFDEAAARRLSDLSEALTPRVAPRASEAPLNGSLAVSLGDQVRLGGVRALGYTLGFTSDTGASYYGDGRLARVDVQNVDGVLVPDTTQYRTDRRGTQEAKLGGIANATLRLSNRHELGLQTLFSHTAESQARIIDGEAGFIATGTRLVDQVASYTERTLASGLVRGRHQLPALAALEVGWRASLARTRLDEPDTRFFAVTVSEDEDLGTTLFSPIGQPAGPQHYVRALGETLATGGLDLTLPVTLGGRGRLKAGGLYERTDRRFDERRLQIVPGAGIRLGGLDPDSVAAFLGPDNVGIVREQETSQGTAYLFGHVLRETTLLQNNYDGGQGVAAAYAMAELPVGPRLRVIAGARVERTALEAITDAVATDADSLVVEVGGERRLGTDRAYTDWLPAVNLVYALSDRMNLRAAATRTLARPTFREVAPVVGFDFATDGPLVGNPALDRTRITNLDLRWEWFTGPGQILAASAFFKRLTDPIERVLIDPSNGATTYDNVDRADLLGAEFEVRQSLGGVAPALAPLSVGLNLSLTRSSITIAPDELERRRALDPSASDTRDLQGQSPYLLNASLAYDRRGTSAGVFFNVAGPRLSRVGNPLPDVYERPAPQLDLVVSQEVFGGVRLKASVKNLLDAPYREAYRLPAGDVTFLEYRRGPAVSFGVSFSPRFGGGPPAAPAVPSVPAGGPGVPAVGTGGGVPSGGQ